MVLRLHCKVAFFSQPLNLVSPVSPEDVASFVSLKIPWGNEYDVTLSDPESSLHFASDSAQSYVAVLAFHFDAVVPQHLNCYTEYIGSSWEHCVSQVFFGDDFSSSQYGSPISLGWIQLLHGGFSQSFDIFELCDLAIAYKGDSSSFFSHSCCASDSVEVYQRIQRYIIIHDMGDVYLNRPFRKGADRWGKN